MNHYFLYNKRLGIELPNFQKEWEAFDEEIQQSILLYWEKIRGTIPDRIADLEKLINKKQEQLGEELNFIRSCQLNSEIADLASVINDLWIWYRSHQDISAKIHS